MKRAWMPLYVGDYLGDTGHLTTAQHGAYLLLMMHYWRKGELPDDDRQLSKIAKLPLKTWSNYRPVLQQFFHSGWKHKRIDAELERVMRVSEKRATAGQKGGLGSALSRLKLENSARGRSLPPAIALQKPSKTQANVDHSHSHSHQTLSLKGDQTSCARSDTAPGAAKDSKSIPVSAELAALIARKTT
ncbi:DUF1376 domain-containing protein [Bradyrhizobium sp.]|uniref:YdaU family protein n=1 Tax=Bradyrhizobium sp. TaxID=376 RepID=UPI0026164AEA|nr:DUF1376 domain-containing protein [Bradyrhizobium sp.]